MALDEKTVSRFKELCWNLSAEHQYERERYYYCGGEPVGEPTGEYYLETGPDYTTRNSAELELNNLVPNISFHEGGECLDLIYSGSLGLLMAPWRAKYPIIKNLYERCLYLPEDEQKRIVYDNKYPPVFPHLLIRAMLSLPKRDPCIDADVNEIARGVIMPDLNGMLSDRTLAKNLLKASYEVEDSYSCGVIYSFLHYQDNGFLQRLELPASRIEKSLISGHAVFHKLRRESQGLSYLLFKELDNIRNKQL